MHNQVVALIVSGRLENKQKLSRILEALPTNLFIVGTLAHAQEVLSEQPISIVFCDERLSDGPYSELVTFAKSRHMGAHFIVMLTNGEWPEFLEALGHELRAPLNAILGWSRLMELGRLGKEESLSGARTIARNARLMAHIVDDLLKMFEFASVTPALQVEGVYLRNVDTRLVVALRTEYYGRFRDELRISDDRLGKRPRSGGVEPYLLRPLREKSALLEVMRTPTLAQREDGSEKAEERRRGFVAHSSPGR